MLRRIVQRKKLARQGLPAETWRATAALLRVPMRNDCGAGAGPVERHGRLDLNGAQSAALPAGGGDAGAARAAPPHSNSCFPPGFLGVEPLCLGGFFRCRHAATAGVHSGGHPHARQYPDLQHQVADKHTDTDDQFHAWLQRQGDCSGLSLGCPASGKRHGPERISDRTRA